MNRDELRDYILQNYAAVSDFPWLSDPSYEVFRHESSRKWFGLVMEVPRNKLGLSGSEPMTIMNLKCEPLLIDALRTETGFYPAYHMNKIHWISVLLPDAPEDMVQFLVNVSFESTKTTKKKTKQPK